MKASGELSVRHPLDRRRGFEAGDVEVGVEHVHSKTVGVKFFVVVHQERVAQRVLASARIVHRPAAIPIVPFVAGAVGRIVFMAGRIIRVAVFRIYSFLFRLAKMSTGAGGSPALPDESHGVIELRRLQTSRPNQAIEPHRGGGRDGENELQGTAGTGGLHGDGNPVRQVRGSFQAVGHAGRSQRT